MGYTPVHMCNNNNKRNIYCHIYPVGEEILFGKSLYCDRQITAVI